MQQDVYLAKLNQWTRLVANKLPEVLFTLPEVDQSTFKAAFNKLAEDLTNLETNEIALIKPLLDRWLILLQQYPPLLKEVMIEIGQVDTLVTGTTRLSPPSQNPYRQPNQDRIMSEIRKIRNHLSLIRERLLIPPVNNQTKD